MSVALANNMIRWSDAASQPIEFDGLGTVKRLYRIWFNCGEFAIINSELLSDLFDGEIRLGALPHSAFREVER